MDMGKAEHNFLDEPNETELMDELDNPVEESARTPENFDKCH